MGINQIYNATAKGTGIKAYKNTTRFVPLDRDCRDVLYTPRVNGIPDVLQPGDVVDVVAFIAACTARLHVCVNQTHTFIVESAVELGKGSVFAFRDLEFVYFDTRATVAKFNANQFTRVTARGPFVEVVRDWSVGKVFEVEWMLDCVAGFRGQRVFSQKSGLSQRIQSQRNLSQRNHSQRILSQRIHSQRNHSQRSQLPKTQIKLYPLYTSKTHSTPLKTVYGPPLPFSEIEAGICVWMEDSVEVYHVVFTSEQFDAVFGDGFEMLRMVQVCIESVGLIWRIVD